MSGNGATPADKKICEQIDGYRFFAWLLGFPSRERYRRIADDDFQAAVADLWTRLSCAGQCPPSLMFEEYEQYEACYISLFDVGVSGPPVPLIESFYQAAVPAQQTLLENAWFFDVIKLKTNPAIGSADHLLTQLEFAASVRYLQDGSGDAPQRQTLCRLERDYLDRHLLSWLPAAAAKLEELRAPVFPAWFSLLLQFLHARRNELE